jgi:zinc/manganese transport system substrate-binding protein
MKKLLFMLGYLVLPSQVFALNVVATLPSLAAIAKDVGGPLVQVEALISPRQDPHYADAKPNLIVTLNRADVVILNGLELEIGWLPPLLLQSRNAKIQKGAAGYVDASQFVQKLGVPKGAIDRALGDVHPGGNPHFLLDPRAGARIAIGVGQALGRADPPNAATYQKNAAILAQKLDALARAEAAKFAQLPPARRNIVAYHDSLTYLIDWLGLHQIATLEPRPGIPPNPQHVAEVLQAMKAAAVPVIAQEEFYPQNTAKTVAQLAQCKVVVLQGGTRFPTQGYAEHVQVLADALYAGLKP